MGKSRRNAHYFRACGSPRATEKKDKQYWHRAYRRAVRMAIQHGAEIMPHFREHSDPWSMSKDGPGFYDKNPPSKNFRA